MSGASGQIGAAERAAALGRVVVMDRDGTLVVDRGYLADPRGLEFLPGAAEGLRRLYARGHRLVVISNQSGIGRGLIAPAQLQAMNARLQQMVRDIGAELAGIYCCPHRPDEGCACRKPQLKLLHDAARELAFDPRAAIVIGDRASDIEFGHRAGATTVLIAAAASGPGVDAAGAPQPDHVAADLIEAARLIEQLQAEPLCT